MNKSIQWHIFDLDGTLYDFGWVKFNESALWKATQAWFYRVMKKYDLSNPQKLYDAMLEREWQEKIPTSKQLADLIGTTRHEVLHEIWGGLEPSLVIKNYSTSQNVIATLSDRSTLFLVTAAPRIWANKALDYMSLRQYFEVILTLEDYWASKWEAFGKIQASSQIPFDKLISIGDQEHSDIIPARELGMATLHVSSPQDLSKLL